MSPQEHVARLERLLERVRKNSALPRTAVAPAPKASQPAAEAKVASRPFHAPPVAPSPAFEPPPRAVEPPPVPDPPPSSFAPVQEAELEPATLPPGPPEAAPVAATPEAPPVEVQEPAAAEPAAPEPSPSPAWTAEHPSAVQTRPMSLPPEELSDDDLLEVTTIPPETAAEPQPELEAPPLVASGSEAVVEEEEQPPASSRRSKVAETLDEALANASQLEQELDQEEEREVPVKTPPPESGPQEAAAPLPPGIAAPGVPDVDGLEADMLGPPSMGPTAEQLGETIELDAPSGPELEIDVMSAGPRVEPERPVEELEVSLPRAPLPSGTYDVAMNPPIDVEVSESSGEAALPPVDLQARDFIPTVPAPEAPSEELAAERTARAQLGATDVARVVLPPSSPPKIFVELLDISLGL